MQRSAFCLFLAAGLLVACQTTRQTATVGPAVQALSDWTAVSNDASPLVDLSGIAGAEVERREQRLYNVGKQEQVKFRASPYLVDVLASARADGFIFEASPTTDQFFAVNGTMLYGRTFDRADFEISRLDDIMLGVVEVTDTLTCGLFYRAMPPVEGYDDSSAIIGTYCGSGSGCDDAALVKVLRDVGIRPIAVSASTAGRDQERKDGSEEFLLASKQRCFKGMCGKSPVYFKIWYNDRKKQSYLMNGYTIYDGRTIMNKKKYLVLQNNSGEKICEGHLTITRFDKKIMGLSQITSPNAS
ncbi:MAG: hypothetical protein QGI13_15905 [Rhodospirillales bacterium]|jgi:hypothetical protein|nr:hypothetical protein [Rhodospirillales bacterium]